MIKIEKKIYQQIIQYCPKIVKVIHCGRAGRGGVRKSPYLRGVLHGLPLISHNNFKCMYNNPVKVMLNAVAKDIKSGFSHICVQTENNDIYAWGLGEYGALGVG